MNRDGINQAYPRNINNKYSDMQVYYFCIYFFTKIYSTTCQFKEHIDLQKIAEIMFQNEKYNVLKPTVHIVKDHFVEFIQKRSIDTSERMFLDRNGLRHIWKGLEFPQFRSLRKADIPQKAIDDKNGATVETTGPSTTAINKNTNTRNETGPSASSKKGNPRETEATTVTPEAKTDLREGETLVKTTFFCPFFGVVRMTTHFNKFGDIGNLTRR